MKNKLLYPMILLLLIMSLVLPVRSAAAEGANKVEFTALSVTDCSADLDWCSYGEQRVLPNGKMFIVGWRLINVFTATDPRWNADCYFEGDPFPPGGGAFPVTGSFTCYPRDPEYAGGWWEGSINQVFMANKVIGIWSAKGYGTLERLQVIVYQNNPHWNQYLTPDTNNYGVITELPGYGE